MGAPTLNRRAMLTAIAAAPAVCAVPLRTAMSSTPADLQWKAALATYRAADAKAAAFLRDRLSTANRRHNDLRVRLGVERGQRLVPPVAEPVLAPSLAKVRALEAEYSDLIGDQAGAGEALMSVPAPDNLALADKFDVFQTETEGAEIPDEWIALLGADIYRLAGRAV